MPRVQQSPAAETDLTDIWLHIARDYVDAANRFLATLQDKCQLIAGHPRMGVERVDLGEDIRIHAIEKYVICYREVSEGIELVRVLHGARDLLELFGANP